MKIINAVWEKRNLGVDCNEIEIEFGDTVEIIKKKSADFETEYTVIKVPIGMVEISNYLQSSGYTFIELMTSCYNKGIIPQLSPLQKRIIESVKCIKMNEEDKKKLFEEVNSGMFIYDRVSLDSKFTEHQANSRYLGWISDDLNLGSKLFKLEYKNQAIGFFSLKHKGKASYVTNLGGLYPSFKKSGFGIVILYHTIKEAIQEGAKKIFTAFSSNNRGAASIHFSLGLVLHKQYYVFVKHKNK